MIGEDGTDAEIIVTLLYRIVDLLEEQNDAIKAVDSEAEARLQRLVNDQNALADRRALMMIGAPAPKQ